MTKPQTITPSLIKLWRKSLASGYHIGTTTGEEAQLLDAWEELHGGWISVENRLPDEKQSVAFIVKSTRDQHLNGMVLGGFYGDGFFYVPGCGFNASYWRPMFLPPKDIHKD